LSDADHLLAVKTNQHGLHAEIERFFADTPTNTDPHQVDLDVPQLALPLCQNMAVVRQFAVKIVRTAYDKLSLKTRRKLAGWDPCYLTEILAPSGR
jgi:hypothetical protein